MVLPFGVAMTVKIFRLNADDGWAEASAAWVSDKLTMLGGCEVPLDVQYAFTKELERKHYTAVHREFGGKDWGMIAWR